MLTVILSIIISLGLILFFCVLFTNAIEWLGQLLNLNEGVIGSILSAIGTALPETIIPIVSILFYKGGRANEIGIGAIVGAPFMLSTLAFFVSGLAVIFYSLFRIRGSKMNNDIEQMSNDLTFFIIMYGAAIISSFVNINKFRTIMIIFLVLSYLVYVKITFSKKNGKNDNIKPFYGTALFHFRTSFGTVLVQIFISLFGIILCANLFVKNIEDISNILGIAPLILSLIITPIATELPEKLNSVIWLGQEKDTLALGNITGAMVFQSCFPVAFCMAFTSWQLTGAALLCALLALISAALNLIWIKYRNNINAIILMTGGLFYLIFVVYILKMLEVIN